MCMKRKGRSKTYIYPCFTVTARSDNEDALLALQEAIGVRGYLARRGRYAATEKRSLSNPCSTITWQSREQVQAVMRLFDEFPLRGIKRHEYAVWRHMAALCSGVRDEASTEAIERLSRELSDLKKYHE